MTAPNGLTERLRGFGAAWRDELAPELSDLTPHAVQFTEVLAENHVHRPARLAHISAMLGGIPVVPHGVSLSLGSYDAADIGDPSILGNAAQATRAPYVSEHVAFVRAGGVEAGHLLPIPRTQSAIDVVARNIDRVRDQLHAPLALEVPAAFLEYPESRWSEGEFMTRLLDRVDCALLLDLANVHANATNHGWSVADVLRQYPLDRIAYCHIAGGALVRGAYFDTHGGVVDPGVLQVANLVGELAARPVPILLEWDAGIPADPTGRLATISSIRCSTEAVHTPHREGTS